MDTQTKIKQGKEKIDELAGQGTVDKLQGKATALLGSAKAKLGELIGDDELRAEGEAKHSEGTAQRLVGEAKEMGEKLSEKLHDAGEVIKHQSAKALDTAESLYEDVKDKVKEASEDAKEKALEASEALKAKAKELKSKLS